MYPDYVVKFLDNTDRFGICAVVFKHKEGRYYSGKYLMHYYDGALIPFEEKQKNYYCHYNDNDNIRFNKILGEEGYDSQECFFFDDENFMYEFICDLF